MEPGGAQPGTVRRVLVVEHEAGAPLGRLAVPLLAGGAHLEVLRPWRGEPLPSGPDALDGVGGLVVLGGQADSWDDDASPWLPATRALLASAARDGVPALGICLGAQLLALATGGRVERGARGPEAGLLEVTATAAGRTDPLVAAVLAAAGAPDGSWRAPQAHGDAVTELPPDAELLASSDLYRVQALRVGERAWGVQYHPEVTAPVLAQWLAEHAALLEARGTSAAAQAAAVEDAEPELALLAAAHAAALLPGDPQDDPRGDPWTGAGTGAGTGSRTGRVSAP